MANINLHNVSAEEEALELASKDLIAFGKLFLWEDFTRSDTPPFHYEVADAIDDHSIRNLAVIIPRGHGKTVLTKCNILKDFVFAEERLFYGWVSATQKLSTGNMDYIKYHLEYNDRFLYYFGNLKGNKWTEEDIELKNGCKLLSRSNVAGIRGAAKLHKRYDLVCLDDFEHEANTITREARDKNANLVTAVVYPALEPHTGRLRINGTPVHFDSFINRILTADARAKAANKKYEWKVITYKAILPDGGALWPSFFPLSLLEKKKQFYRDSGEPAKFYQEYMMEVQSEEDALFTRDMIQYHNARYEYDLDQKTGYLTWNGETFPVNCFLGCDPATDIDTKESDFSVIMVVAVDQRNNMYVLDYVRERSIPTVGHRYSDGEIEKKGVVDYIFEMYDKYHCSNGTVEDVAMNRSIFQVLDNLRKERNRFDVAILPGKPGGRDKRNRIYSILSGRFGLRTIYLKEGMVDLIDEILTFGPRMAHDDTIEALAYSALNAYPSKMKKDEKTGEFSRYRPQPKNWMVA